MLIMNSLRESYFSDSNLDLKKITIKKQTKTEK